MSATNHTTNLSLSQFVNTDVPAWRQDYNGDMLKIDNAYTADISSATAETSADPSDYMKFYDVSATTNKKILISDLLKGAKVEDLTDTDITTPTDDDGLVYDSTAQKWENVPIMTKEQWKKNGAYNLCPVTAKTQLLGGLTITVNSDGSVTVGSGTATSLIDLALNVKTDMTLADGDYRLVGCPNHPYVSLRVVTNNYNVNKVYDYGTGGNFSFSNSVDKNAAVYLRVNSGTVISSPITFKPMITTDLNATYDDYVPYAKTNRELTFNVVQDSSVEKTFAYNNAICICSIIVKNLSLTPTGSWVTAYSLPSGIPKPKQETSFIANTFPYTAGKSNAVVGRVTTDGDFQIWLDSGSSTPVSQVAMNFMYPV